MIKTANFFQKYEQHLTAPDQLVCVLSASRHAVVGLGLLLLVSCGGGSGGAAQPATPSNSQESSTVTVEVTKSSPIAVNIPIIAGASDPFGGNAAGTAALDFDGDGLKDLVITPSYLSRQPELPVILLRQTATGFVDATNTSFSSGVPTTGVARTALIADFNGDGKEDYFAADTGLEVLNNGSFILSQNRFFASDLGGTLTASQPPTLAFNHGACKGDIDGDGRVDVIVAPLSPPKSYILLNTTTGFVFNQSQLPPELRTFTAQDFNPSSCTLADMNGDGKLDLIMSSYGDGIAANAPNSPYATGTRIFFNDGLGRFAASTVSLPRPVGVDWGSTSIYAVDFDKNGLLDILIAYETVLTPRFALQLWSQISSGNYRDTTVSAFGAYETGIGFWRELDVGDFNGDGTVDIYLKKLAHEQGSFEESLRKRILLNDGTGKFAPTTKSMVLSQSVNPAFLVFSGFANGRMTLLGYQALGNGAVYTSLIPLKLSLKF